MARILDENDKYAVLRFALIAQFADHDFMEKYELDIEHFQQVYDFLKKIYFEHSKYFSEDFEK